MEQTEFKLSHHTWKKRHFDPNSVEDIKQYKHFLENRKWDGNCPFVLEWPHLTMTDMIRTKLIEAHIDNMIKAAVNEHILS